MHQRSRKKSFCRLCRQWHGKRHNLGKKENVLALKKTCALLKGERAKLIIEEQREDQRQNGEEKTRRRSDKVVAGEKEANYGKQNETLSYRGNTSREKIETKREFMKER